MVILFILLNIITAIVPLFRIVDNTPQIINMEIKKMNFSISSFTVDSSKPVEIYLVNNDIIRHNILIIAPGTLEIVGKKADIMATTADGVKKNWVPDSPDILFHSPLIGIGEKYILKFTAPSKKGNYPFVCTFPTHWRTMHGIMIVQ